MRDAINIQSIATASPDYMGFIFFSDSPRYVGNDFHLPHDFPHSIKKVGVFVNATTTEMLKQYTTLQLHYLQLHGAESVQQCEELKREGVKLIKVFSVGEDFDFHQTSPYKAVSDFFLFDTKGKYYGGNARTFDWSILETYDQQVPFFLSGGISPYNISKIRDLKNMNIHAVDINSGVEITPGIKDIEKVKDIKCEL